MVIRYARLTGDGRCASVIATTFTAAQSQHAKFVNTYYDDNAWWALAWIAAFDLTRESRYLEAARTIFARNAAAWDHSCGGGLRWHAKSTYKNAITNELFVTLAALLHQRSPGGGYLTWAQRGWEWFSARGFIGPARPGQRRDHPGLPEQRRHHLDIQPGRDPGRARRAVRDHR